MHPNRHLFVGVDVGGTFTDIAATDGEIWSYAKIPSDNANPERAILEGIRKVADGDLASVEMIIHGSTIVPNTVLEKKGAKLAVITTSGFRDVFGIGREFRFDSYDLNIEKPESLCPRNRIFEIGERVLADGTCHTPIDERELDHTFRKLEEAGAESVAIVLMHSYANPTHEDTIAQHLDGRFDVSKSSAVAPVIGEYLRGSTTLINAYVQPVVVRYLKDLSAQLAAQGFKGRLFLMISQAAITDLTDACSTPVKLLEAGTSAGVIAAVHTLGTASGDDVVSFDVGGTTAKICLCRKGEIPRARELEIARQNRFKRGSGFPIRIDGVELLEIGAGGGSIVSVDQAGWIKVGPQSAGANPGPACYGSGGTQPTVTDANLLLGYLDPDNFAGGSMRLLPDEARACFEDISRRLEAPVVDIAAAVFSMINTQMADALRLHVIERGGNPTKATMVAFGGGGPLHGYEVARLAGLGKIVVPPQAGVTSAIGLLLAPPAYEASRNLYRLVGGVDLPDLSATIDELVSEVSREFTRKFGSQPTKYFCFSDMSYVGQGNEIIVRFPVPEHGQADPIDDDAILHKFEKSYRELGGNLVPGVAIQMTRVTVRGEGDPFVIRSEAAVNTAAAEDHCKYRDVYFPENGAFLETAVIERRHMVPARTYHGPLLIEEAETTTVIGPSATASLDPHSNIRIEFVVRPK